jgi:hypothetical protein
MIRDASASKTVCNRIKFKIKSIYHRRIVYSAVLSNVFIYWGASDRWLWRRGHRVTIVIIIIINNINTNNKRFYFL